MHNIEGLDAANHCCFWNKLWGCFPLWYFTLVVCKEQCPTSAKTHPPHPHPRTSLPPYPSTHSHVFLHLDPPPHRFMFMYTSPSYHQILLTHFCLATEMYNQILSFTSDRLPIPADRVRIDRKTVTFYWWIQRIDQVWFGCCLAVSLILDWSLRSMRLGDGFFHTEWGMSLSYGN